MSQAVDIIFYDGIVSKPHHAQISAQSKSEVLIRYGEQLEQQRHYQYTDMKLIGALGQLHPVIELYDDARIEFHSALPECLITQLKRFNIRSGNLNALRVLFFLV